MEDRLIISLSKKEATKLAREIENDDDQLKELIALIQRNEYPVSAKASWVLRTAADRNASIVQTRISLLVKLTREIDFSGTRRDLLKSLLNLLRQKSPLDEEDGSLILNLAFERLAAPKAATAERYYSMEMICYFLDEYPELYGELETTFEIHADKETANYQSHGRSLLTKYASKAK